MNSQLIQINLSTWFLCKIYDRLDKICRVYCFFEYWKEIELFSAESKNGV